MAERSLPQRHREELQLMAVREILRATAAALPLDEILTVIANMSIIVFDARASWFMLADGERLRTVVARGESAEELSATRCVLAQGKVGSAALGGQPVILPPTAVERADPVLGVLGRGRPVVLLPLRTPDRILGLLGAVVTSRAARDVSFLVTLAEQASSAVEAARLREETGLWRGRLDAVFEHMTEVVLVYDREGKLALMNAAAERVLGPRGVRLGDTVEGVASKVALGDSHGRPLPWERAACARAVQGELVEHQEESLLLPGGELRYFVVSAVPLTVAGRVQGAVVVWRDITHIKELEHMRAQFLAMVSHELRTPLTSIMGYAQVLRRDLASGRPPVDPQHRLTSIVDQAQRANTLIADLLEVARVETGHLSLNLQDVALSDLVRKTVEDSAALAPDHRFTLELPDTAPVVRADPGRIEQVMRNLLSNAVKYSPLHTAIRVRVRPEREWVVVSVADQGRGIAKEDLPLVFLPFRRFRQGQEWETVGVGLGLFICRGIVAAHGGEIWVESAPGAGSTFSFSLPLR
ncbi:MAG: GAF domain-containing protein [Chloroflexi bacterium]|nr:GAF domain-containing protein [Chloroflexota bacterium]